MIMYAMMASLLAYIIVVEVVSRTTSGPDLAPSIDLIRYIFYAVAVSMIFMAQLIKGLMLRDVSRLDPDTALARLRLSTVFVAMLAETPAILGLVMYVVWRQYMDFYILAFVSLYIMVRHFPRRSTWERVMASAKRGA